MLPEVMDAEACGHVYMHPNDRLAATIAALNTISVDDVNMVHL